MGGTCHFTNLVGAFEEQTPRKQFSDSTFKVV